MILAMTHVINELLVSNFKLNDSSQSSESGKDLRLIFLWETLIFLFLTLATKRGASLFILFLSSGQKTSSSHKFGKHFDGREFKTEFVSILDLSSNLPFKQPAFQATCLSSNLPFKQPAPDDYPTFLSPYFFELLRAGSH